MKNTDALNLKKRAINSGLWVTLSYGFKQALRLGSNLIVTRLLFPEAFGLMAIVQTVIFGLIMMSDIGIQPSIIQNKRGNDPNFLNTAWSIQVAQGALIYLTILISAPFFAEFYHQPILSQLLPVVGLGALISGFQSTKLATANRELNMARVTIIEVVTFVINIIIMIFLAWLYKSVWSLVWGALIGNLLKTLASHYLLVGEKNHFAWEKSSVKALFGFGSWIFMSSALTFLADEGNKLFVAKLLDVKTMAFYTLASTMCMVFWQTIAQLASKILLPTYSEVLRNNPNNLNKVLAKTRLAMIAPGWAIALFFVFFGEHFMNLVYDHRYSESGIILRILAMGSLAGIIQWSYSGILIAKGMVRANTFVLALQIMIQLLAILIGYHFHKDHGVIIALAAISWLLYPAYSYIYFRAGVWQPKIDIPLLIISLLIVVLESMSINYI